MFTKRTALAVALFSTVMTPVAVTPAMAQEAPAPATETQKPACSLALTQAVVQRSYPTPAALRAELERTNASTYQGAAEQVQSRVGGIINNSNLCTGTVPSFQHWLTEYAQVDGNAPLPRAEPAPTPTPTAQPVAAPTPVPVSVPAADSATDPEVLALERGLARERTGRNDPDRVAALEARLNQRLNVLANRVTALERDKADRDWVNETFATKSSVADLTNPDADTFIVSDEDVLAALQEQFVTRTEFGCMSDRSEQVAAKCEGTTRFATVGELADATKEDDSFYARAMDFGSVAGLILAILALAGLFWLLWNRKPTAKKPEASEEAMVDPTSTPAPTPSAKKPTPAPTPAKPKPSAKKAPARKPAATKKSPARTPAAKKASPKKPDGK